MSLAPSGDAPIDALRFGPGMTITADEIAAYGQAYGATWLISALARVGLRLAEIAPGSTTFKLEKIPGEFARKPWARIAGGST